MTLERNRLIGVARAERARLGRTIQYARPESWENPSPCAGWRNVDVLSHLAGQESAAAQLLDGGEPAEFAGFREANGGDLWIDGFNEWSVTRRRSIPSREIIEEWGRWADVFLDRAADLPDERWSSIRVPWFEGSIGVRFLVQSRIVEWWLHGEDVREGAGMGSNPQHWPIHLACDLGIRMLPYALGLEGLSFPGASLQIDLDGMGEGGWHWALTPGETPPRNKKPDAFIIGRAAAFALVAGRRVPAGFFLDEGSLLVGGDEQLAERVLEVIRAFPA